VKTFKKQNNPKKLMESEKESIILEHLKYVGKIAAEKAKQLPPGPVMNYDDLFTAGCLGLIDAADKYNPQKGMHFKGYADIRIKGEILSSLRELDHLSRQERQILTQYREIQRKNNGDGIEETCRIYGIQKSKLLKIIEKDESLSHPVELTPNSASREYDLDTALDIRRMIEKIQGFKFPDKRQIIILKLYYWDGLTMSEIGERLGCDESRVSQLHDKAISYLRKMMGVMQK
jgi:RNA polymerase sigma factor for flagellar operon FliA